MKEGIQVCVRYYSKLGFVYLCLWANAGHRRSGWAFGALKLARIEGYERS